MTAARGDLRVDRWVPANISIPFEGFDFTTPANLTMQVRLYPDATGDPLISLTETTAPAQGLSMSIETEDGLTTSTLNIRINETTIESLLPFPSNGTEPGAEVELWYAVHFSAAAYTGKRRWLEGKFIIIPGANQA
jgi:hypothetical protein